MAIPEKKSSTMSWVTTGVLVVGIAGAFVYKFMFATPVDPVRKLQMDPEGGVRAYLKVSYGFLTDTATFFDLEKVVPKDDYDWFQKNYTQFFHDAYNVRSGIDPNQGDALAKISVMRDILSYGPNREDCEIRSKDVKDNTAEVIVRKKTDHGGLIDCKIRLIREGRYWKVKDFAGGKMGIQNIDQPGDFVWVERDKEEGEFAAAVKAALPSGGAPEAPGAVGAPPGMPPGAFPGGQTPPPGMPPAAATMPNNPTNPMNAGAPPPLPPDAAGAGPFPPGTLDGPAAVPPSGMVAAAVPGMPPGAAPGAPMPGGPGEVAAVPAGMQPIATSAAPDMAAYMKELDAQAAKNAPPTGNQPVRPGGYQPGFVPAPGSIPGQPLPGAAPPGGAVAAPPVPPPAGAPVAGAPPAVRPTALTIADADRLVQLAREDWNAQRYQDSVTKAQQALDIYKQQLGANDPKTVELQKMVNAARQALSR